jgi:hypothetical protein
MSEHAPDDGAEPVAERHAFDYDWTVRFPDAQQLTASEGRATFAAQTDDAWWIIHDAGGLVDPDGEPGALPIEVIRFSDEQTWESRVAALRRQQRRRRASERLRGRAPYEDLTIAVQWTRGDRRGRHRIELGQVWRANDSDEVIIVASRDGEPRLDEEGWIHFWVVIDDLGLLSLMTDGVMSPDNLTSKYTLLSDPDDPDLRWMPPRHGRGDSR